MNITTQSIAAAIAYMRAIDSSTTPIKNNIVDIIIFR